MAVESPLFTKLVDLGAMLSHEHQLVAQERIAEHGFQFDMARGVVAFTGPRPFEAPMHILGSAAPGPRSFLWSWANEASGIPPALTAVASQLREFGATHGVPEFSQPELPFAEGTDGVVTWSRLAIAATKAKGSVRTFVPAPAPGGTVVLVLVDSPEFALPAPDAARTMRVITETLAATALSTHSNAVYWYATERGIPVDWNGGSPVLTLPGARLEVMVDDSDRIVDLRMLPA